MTSKIIKENYTVAFNGTIWKQFFRPDSTHFIIEERFEDLLQTQLHCIDVLKGELLETITPKDEWWETTSSVTSTEIITTLFGEKNAEQKELRSYSLTTTVNNSQSDVIHPSIYREETNKEYFEEVAAFVSECTNTSPLFALEYIELHGLIVISYYIHGSKKLENHLVIFNAEDGSIEYTTCIGSDLSGIAFDTFVVMNDQLIFVKNLKELHCIKLGI